LGGEGYIDHWVYLQGNKPTQELWCVSGQIIYQDHIASILSWKKNGCQGILFQPPDDHASWENMQELEAELGQEPPTFFPKNMYLSLPGDEWGLVGVAANDIRHLASGYRLILEVLAESSQFGDDPINATTLPPGRYVLQWINGEFSIAPLMPARIELEMHVLNDPYRIYLQAGNQGGEDIRSASLQLVASCGGEPQELAWQELDLWAGEIHNLSVMFLPPVEHSCTLQAQMLNANGGLLADKKIQLDSVETYWLQQKNILAISNVAGKSWSAVIILMLVSVFTGALGLYYMVSARRP
jgi:hypothetical protein